MLAPLRLPPSSKSSWTHPRLRWLVAAVSRDEARLESSFLGSPFGLCTLLGEKGSFVRVIISLMEAPFSLYSILGLMMRCSLSIVSPSGRSAMGMLTVPTRSSLVMLSLSITAMFKVVVCLESSQSKSSCHSGLRFLRLTSVVYMVPSPPRSKNNTQKGSQFLTRSILGRLLALTTRTLRYPTAPASCLFSKAYLILATSSSAATPLATSSIKAETFPCSL
mmetsp:Transcript_11128/g.17489  ORF Transcript_11128/g.17489 Transcript_11128/m.17489 type:complete len:221 (-) Transcript_11128:614-1276(-)